MNDFFTTKGTLTVSIGEGYLSSFEASTLKKGDIVRTTRICGAPSMIHFNGTPLCPCEVVVLGDVFGIRVTERPSQERSAPGPGARDDLVEILPTMVSLGSIRMSLAELKNAGPGTIISLGKPYLTDIDAELLVAGVPVAEGKVVCLKEEMGIRIVKIEGTHFKETNIRSSGYLAEPDSPSFRCVAYDFLKPDVFTLNNIMKMNDIHTLFLRNLKAGLPGLADMLVDQPLAPAWVDQLNFGEIIATLPKEVKCKRFLAEIAKVRSTRESARKKNGPSREVKGFIEEEGSAHSINPLARDQIEKMQKQMGLMSGRNPIIFFYRDEEPMRDIFETTEGRKALLACLRGAWKNLVDLNIQAVIESGALPGSAVLHESEMIVIVGFMGRDGRFGFSIIYPYLTLEPYMGLLE
ncbi:MAG: FliM/FliN family flagellar motor switch protein [Spirochaetia bacterium]|jgi:flagellar motor switch/type III secretory pathway protein FliN